MRRQTAQDEPSFMRNFLCAHRLISHSGFWAPLDRGLPGLVPESGLGWSSSRTREVGGGSRCHESSLTGVVPDVRCVLASTSDIWKS